MLAAVHQHLKTMAAKIAQPQVKTVIQFMIAANRIDAQRRLKFAQYFNFRLQITGPVVNNISGQEYRFRLQRIRQCHDFSKRGKELERVRCKSLSKASRYSRSSLGEEKTTVLTAGILPLPIPPNRKQRHSEPARKHSPSRLRPDYGD